MESGEQVEGGFGCGRAFSNGLRDEDVQRAHKAMDSIWGDRPILIDTMAGGGSIPFEAARLGLHSMANEYNPVACSILEATIDYPIQFGTSLVDKVRHWGKKWEERSTERLAPFYPKESFASVYAYIYARTVPCPDTDGHPQTPLVPSWSLAKPKQGRHVVAEPVVSEVGEGNWSVRIRDVGKGAGELRQPPGPTYRGGTGTSIFSGGYIPRDYIKAAAQSGAMKSELYAVATKTGTKMHFRPAEARDLLAIKAAHQELERVRPEWETSGIIPTEQIPPGDKTGDNPNDSGTDLPRKRGEVQWQGMFASRQLLSLGTLVQELGRIRAEVVKAEGNEVANAVIHLLSCAFDKFLNYNATLASWHAPRTVMRSVFDRHDYAFKATFAELAPCEAGSGLAWAIGNVVKAYKELAELPRTSPTYVPVISQGSATNLLELENKSVTAVVVDPPYANNVQYAELADFFYVWLKRTQGYRRPEWFSTYLCDHDEEAVVNIVRHRRDSTRGGAAQGKQDAHSFYQSLMTDCFREAKRILRDDGVLTVMFTHKQQEAWAALFESLIAAGFTIVATWPIQTESQHSLHQAKKNAAQSTVLLVARKRDSVADRGYFDDAMKDDISHVARGTAARLKAEGLNAVDQLVGAFGPAMEVFSRYDDVKTDTGEKVAVADAIQTAADAVAKWRVEQLAERGLEGVDGESRFALLCWDVLGAAEFRFNEAMLLGRAVGIDVARLKETGLVSTTGDKVKMLRASERRREKPIRSEQEQLALFTEHRRTRAKPSRKVHPNDEYFVSAIDMCHALALRHEESGGGQAGVGAARGMALQQGWGAESGCARLMTAMVNAAPLAVRFPGKGRVRTQADEFPEFRAWHAMLKPLFSIDPPLWKEPTIIQGALLTTDEDDDDEESGEDD